MPLQRHHVVLVPGFAGFDALGQLHYYTGVTAAYKEWRTTVKGSTPPLELHYFDNLPTAAVATRAERLRLFLAKRVTRGAFRLDAKPDDGSEDSEGGEKVILVGHSTGGLDIRRLLFDLQQLKNRGEDIWVDGEVQVSPEDVLRQISGVVFLSVPQYGTNIGDWVTSHPIQRKFFAWLAGFSVPLASRNVPFQVVDRIHEAGATMWRIVTAIPVIGTLASTVGGAAAGLLPGRTQSWLGVPVVGEDLQFAIEDSLRESSQEFTNSNPIKESKAREAASELQLWLDNIKADFAAIDDLRNSRFVPDSPACDDIRRSPAHYSEDERRAEIDCWKAHSIATLSFATMGNRPPPFGALTAYHDQPAPVWNPIDPIDDYKLNAPDFDSTYLAAYFACAGRRTPSQMHETRPDFETYTGERDLKGINGKSLGGKVHIEKWDNDGIVNTASMLWPDEENTRLVHGDHGDIVGHYTRDPVVHGDSQARRFLRYDLFKSQSGKHIFKTPFKEVWEEIFGFCLNPITVSSGQRRRH